MSTDDPLEQQAALQAYREAAGLYKKQEFEKACEMLERLAALYPNHETVRDALTMCETAIAKKKALEIARRHALDYDIGEDFPEEFGDDTPLPEEAPTPVPFDTVQDSEEELSPIEVRPGLPLIAIVLGAIVGVGVGVLFGGPGDMPMEGAVVSPPVLPALTGLRVDLEDNYPGPLDAKVVADVMTLGEGPLAEIDERAADTWSASPEWIHGRVRFWRTSWGDFYEYRPEVVAEFAHITVVLPPATKRGVSHTDSARAIIEHETIQYYADRTGYPVIVLVADGYPDYARGEASDAFGAYVDHVFQAVGRSISHAGEGPILLGIGEGGTVALSSERIAAHRVVACRPRPVPNRVRDDVGVIIVAGADDEALRAYENLADGSMAGNVGVDPVENASDRLEPLFTAALPHLIP